MEIVRLLRHDRPGSDGRVHIHLRVCWLGNKVRLSSGEKVLPADWDSKKEEVKARRHMASDINYRLDTYTTGLRNFIYRTENNGQAVTPDMVRAEVDRIRTEVLGQKRIEAPAIVKPSLPTPYEFVTRYRAERTADRSDSWQHSMKVVGAHLEAFRSGLKWEDLTMSNLNLFKVYLQEEEEVSDATLSSYIGLLRGMLKYAGRIGMPVPADYTYLELRKTGDTLQPELEHGEINKLINARLKHRPLAAAAKDWDIDTMEQTRWFFIMACHTGLRHSDLWQLLSPRLTHIEGHPCLEISQQKTNKRVPVPLPDDIYHLLKHPPTQKPPTPRDQYNPMLKSIAEQAELNRPVIVGTYYKGDLLSEQLKLYETMSSHMARRTFATMMTAGGMPTKVLQEIMGHSNISSTEKYTKVSSNVVVLQTIEAWQRARQIHGPRPQP